MSPKSPKTIRENKSKHDSIEQHARFVEAAKKAEADESPDAMEKAFKKIAPRLATAKK